MVYSTDMNAQQIRTKYLEFYRERGHEIIPRAQLVLSGDPTTLFTGSGMQPMIPYLLGETHPKGVRLADSQTCLRAQDIEDIGDNRHTTFFEMLGNWSLGDYFKQEQIDWMFEFLTEIVGLDASRIYVTCYSGNPEYQIPKDTQAAEMWAKLFADSGLSNATAEIGSEENGYGRGIKDGERIFFYDGSKNWWSRSGPEATTPAGDPCGPDSEMFYQFDIPHNPAFGEHCHPNCDCGRFMEIGNNVFMGYKKIAEGQFELLKKPNIDHGSGLERIAAAAINDPDVFKISLLWPIIQKLEELSGKKYESHLESMRVIADHLRAATFLAVDGCVPSNKEQGYVMRRLVRRAMIKAFDLGVEQSFIEQVVPVITQLYEADYSEVKERSATVVEVLSKEEKVFRTTLRKGKSELGREINRQFIKTRKIPAIISGEYIFTMYDTHGFPAELSLEAIATHSLEYHDKQDGNRYTVTAKASENWREEFDVKMTEQRERSQTAQKGVFKGGLEGYDDIHVKYHTATHLMYKALRMVLGEHVVQRGSNITSERLRFDFSHPEKVTRDQLDQVETIVNEVIRQDVPMSWKEYPTKEAFKRGALGAFGDKYGDTVKVYQAGDGDEPFSLEICGGPHVESTGKLAEGDKKFVITKEEASSAGIRRIKAVLK